MNFGEKLKQLRIGKELTQGELAKILDVSKSNISKYESGSIEPNLDILIRMATYFDVPVDFLLGLSENHSTQDNNYFFFFFDNIRRKIFADRLRTALADIGITENEFVEQVSIGREKAIMFLSANGDPTADDLIEISHFLETSIDYLLGQVPKVSNVEKKLLNAFVKLNTDYKDIIIGKAKELLIEQESSFVAASEPIRKAK